MISRLQMSELFDPESMSEQASSPQEQVSGISHSCRCVKKPGTLVSCDPL